MDTKRIVTGETEPVEALLDRLQKLAEVARLCGLDDTAAWALRLRGLIGAVMADLRDGAGHEGPCDGVERPDLPTF